MHYSTDLYTFPCPDALSVDSGNGNTTRRKEVGMSVQCTMSLLFPLTHLTSPHTHYTTDASYTDPLGDLPERPKTAARQRPADDDEFMDAELGDDLLPE